MEYGGDEASGWIADGLPGRREGSTEGLRARVTAADGRPEDRGQAELQTPSTGQSAAQMVAFVLRPTRRTRAGRARFAVATCWECDVLGMATIRTYGSRTTAPVT